MNDDLAICIPTFNRANTLRNGLCHLIPIALQFEIPIYSSDNASTDNTVQVVEEAKSEYPFLFFHQNTKNIGMDGNFEVALKLSSARYSWLLGDDDLINSDQLGPIVDRICTSDYDLILLNGGSADPRGGRVVGYPSRKYSNAEEFMSDLGWHATWISGLIFSRELINKMLFRKYIGTYFSHFGSLFDVLAKKDLVNIFWYENSAFYPSSLATFSWASRVLEIFSENWTKVVLSLPSRYPLLIKHKCIEDHGSKTGLFSFSGMINLRAQGAITRDKMKCYAQSFILAGGVNLRVGMLIAMIPIFPLKLMRSMYIRFRLLFKNV